MKAPWVKILCIALAMGIALLANRPAHADGFEDLQSWEVADDQEINEIRGGYVTEGGLQFSIGIEKTVLVNGIQQASNFLNIVQDGSGIPQVSQVPNSMLTLVQIGHGKNTFEPGNLPSGFFTVVQNSMDQQFIQNMTKISTIISVLGLHREIGQATNLNHQLVQSLR
ncbi:MAG: hypothetical protein WBA34_01045 [Candidatus Deferrimicrobiaceae bacterium]